MIKLLISLKHYRTISVFSISILAISIFCLYIIKYFCNNTLPFPYIWYKHYNNIHIVNSIITNDDRIYVCGGFENVLYQDHSSSPISSNGDLDACILDINDSGTIDNALTYGSISLDEVNDMSIVDDSIIAAGIFSESVQIDNNVIISNGNTDCIVISYDEFRNIRWTCYWGSKGNDNISSIALDNTGSIYIVGYITDLLEPNGLFINVGIQQLNRTCFFIKIDSSGNLLWVHPLGGQYPEFNCNDIKISINGDIYIVGEFIGSYSLGLTNEDGFISSQGRTSTYLAKYDTMGNLIWADTWSAMKPNFVLDDSQNIYVTGFCEGDIDFDPGDGEILHHVLGKFDGYVSKINSDGNILWNVTWGGIDNRDSNAECSGNYISNILNGKFYITGKYYGLVGLNTNYILSNNNVNKRFKSYLIEFNEEGAYSNLLNWGYNTMGYERIPKGIIVDKNNHIYIVGNDNGLYLFKLDNSIFNY